MGKRTIRLGSAISFDEEKEADIINKVEFLLSKHKLGDFIGNLLRVTLESPDKLDSRDKLNKSLEEIAEYGMTYDRYKFFTDVSKSIEDLKNKVDSMYEMNMKLMCLAQFGKHIGLEAKTNNSLMAQFVLEKQLEDITNKLGVAHVKHVFSSNKILETEEKAKDVLEYIIETYDSIVSEIQSNIFKEIELKVNTVPGTIVQQESIVEEVKEEKKEDIGEQIIDFGKADLGALTNFFGE